jgi:hypothetical protein
MCKTLYTVYSCLHEEYAGIWTCPETRRDKRWFCMNDEDNTSVPEQCPKCKGQKDRDDRRGGWRDRMAEYQRRVRESGYQGTQNGKSFY